MLGTEFCPQHVPKKNWPPIKKNLKKCITMLDNVIHTWYTETRKNGKQKKEE